MSLGQDRDGGDRSELEIRLQELAWKLTAERDEARAERDEWMASSAGYGSDAVEWKIRCDELQAGYDKLGPLLVAQAKENVALRAENTALRTALRNGWHIDPA